MFHLRMHNATYLDRNHFRRNDLFLDDINKYLVTNGIDNELFMPADAFAELFTEERIKDEFPEGCSDLIIFVSTEAPKVFASVRLTFKHYKDAVVHIMKMCYEHGLIDACLPILETSGQIGKALEVPQSLADK